MRASLLFAGLAGSLWLRAPVAAAADVENTSADLLYLDALQAWNAGDAEEALARSLAVLERAPDHAPARLLEGYSLARVGDHAAASAVLHGLADDPWLGVSDPEVYALATRWIRTVDGRFDRDAVSVSAGLAGIGDRDPLAGRLVPSLAIEVDVPVAGALHGRLDLVPPWTTWDALELSGPVASALAVVHLPLGDGMWGADLGAGPSVQVGGTRVDARVQGVFPGARGAAGVDLRAHPRVGGRMEFGWLGHLGARQGLPFGTQGVDLRFLLTAYAR